MTRLRRHVAEMVSGLPESGEQADLFGAPKRVVPPTLCDWCRKPLPAGRRKDAITCSKACRQARHRFRVRAVGITATQPIRVAYADPPYPKLARKYYADEEVDHVALVGRLEAEFPDGWALSTSKKALPAVLALCPDDVDVNVWRNGPRGTTKSFRARNAWEALIIRGGRPYVEGVAEDLHDLLDWHGRQHSHPDALVGMKPAAFCEWMFRLLGLQRGDTLVDLFPGSGAVGRAWRLYTSPEYSSTLPSRLDEAAG